SETDVVLVRSGQKATVTLDAFAGQSFGGAVTEIGALAETNRGNTTYAVTIALDPTTTGLRWGMTAFADISVAP
nr:HlyD family efflux transporter periplasmic adaptor subunit [Chloroflexota bacterium]